MTQISNSQAMLRAIYIAQKGKYRVHPNPLVGCVITLHGELVSEGWHSEYGKAHAEVNAIEAIPENLLNRVSEMELFVSLEPCAHYGKTPPCSDLLIQKGVKRVYVASLDPNPETAGKGIQKMKDAGIFVQLGLHEQEAIELNKAFFHFFQQKKTYIVGKHAETSNRIFGVHNQELAISSHMGRLYGHQLRNTFQAILIGTNTLKTDQPTLTSRLWRGKQPIRLVIDMELKYPDLYPESTEDSAVRPICRPDLARMLPNAIAWSGNWKELPHSLYKAGLQSVLIEGGKYVLSNLLKHGLMNEYHIIRSEQPYKGNNGIEAPSINTIYNYQYQCDTDSVYVFK